MATKQLVMFAIIPPSPEREELRALQEDYATRVASPKTFTQPPHITLVHPCMVANLENLRERLTLACSAHQPFEIRMPTIGFFRHHPTLYYTVAPSEALQRLHEDLLELMSEVRERDFNAYYRTAQGRAGELLRTYGSEYVKEHYFPHLSLTRSDADKEKFKALVHDLPMGMPVAFTVARVALLVHGPDGWFVESEYELH